MEGEVSVFANQEFLAELMCQFQFMSNMCHFLFQFLTVVNDLTQSTLKSVGFGASLWWTQCLEMLTILIKHKIFSQAGAAMQNFELPQDYFQRQNTF